MIFFKKRIPKKIRKAYKYVLKQCSDKSVAYSQSLRGNQLYNGIRHYDCSSLMWYALKDAGFDLSGYPFTTYTMPQILKGLGFKELPANAKWRRGDILWKETHTEMCYRAKRKLTMGAHGASYALVDQVSTKDKPAPAGYWTKIFRYEEV